MHPGSVSLLLQTKKRCQSRRLRCRSVYIANAHLAGPISGAPVSKSGINFISHPAASCLRSLWHSGDPTIVHRTTTMSRSMIQSLAPGIRTAMKPRLSAMAIRQASSSAASSSQATSPRSSDPATSTSTGRLPMTWPDYLATRKQKRIFSTVATIPTTLAGMVGGGSYFAGLESEPGQLILGVEPM